MPNLKQQFGKRVQEARKRRGLTQEQLAELVDTTRDTIRNIENGVHGPRFGLLEKIANALDVEPRELF